MRKNFSIPLVLTIWAAFLCCHTSAAQTNYQNGGKATIEINANQPGSYGVVNSSSSQITTVTPVDCENRWTDFYLYQVEKTYNRTGQLYYTQGLTFTDANTLLESSGLYGESKIQYLNLNNMKVKKQTKLDNQYFGEGCDFIGNEIFQLTWRERKVFVWDATTLKLKRTMDIPKEIKEGWGLAKRVRKDSKNKEIVELYVTDGSTKVYVVDPKTFKVKTILQTRMESCVEFDLLNELEFVEGKLWANMYYNEIILIINPDDGFIEGFIDMTGITELARLEAVRIGAPWQEDYVLNGIAYHPDTKKLLVTGKKWPVVFEISVSVDNS